MARFRSLKTDLRSRLEGDDWETHIPHMAALPGKEALGPLLSFLLLGGTIKWRAAAVFGQVMNALATSQMEEARVVMRRLMWHMNEESGNIGWGIPEAMAETLAANRKLAEEYSRILVSYIRNREGDSNFVDHAPLRRFCFLAVARLAQAWPDLAAPAREAILAGLEDEDAPCRGGAAYVAGIMGLTEALPLLPPLIHNEAPVELFHEGRVDEQTTGTLAQSAMAKLQNLRDTQ